MSKGSSYADMITTGADQMKENSFSARSTNFELKL